MIPNSQIVQRYARIAAENADFEAAMIQLTSVVGGSFDVVSRAFCDWLQTTVFPWRVAFDYCLSRAREGKSLPFTTQ